MRFVDFFNILSEICLRFVQVGDLPGRVGAEEVRGSLRELSAGCHAHCPPHNGTCPTQKFEYNLGKYAL